MFLMDILKNCQQRLALNDYFPSSTKVIAGFPQGLDLESRFSLDPCKQAQQELLFSQKNEIQAIPIIMPVHQVKLEKPLDLLLDPKISFDEHIQCILNKTPKIIGLIRKLQPAIPRTSLLLALCKYSFFFLCFFYVGFLSRTFMINMTAGEGEGYLFNSSLPLPSSAQALRH